MKTLPLCFAAGCFGALVNIAVVWIFDNFGIMEALQVRMPIAYSAEWMYQRIVWGGIWGFLFMLPLYKSSILMKGTIISLIPSLFQLFYVFPQLMGADVAGLNYGVLTPALILILTWVWGIATALGIKMFR